MQTDRLPIVPRPSGIVAAVLMLVLLTASTVPAQILTSPDVEVSTSNGAVVSITNRLTGEKLTVPAKDPYVAELHALEGKGFPMSDGQVASKTGDGFVEHSASRGDGTRLSTRFESDSGSVIVTQSGTSNEGGVYGISWRIADIPDSISVLVPGNSGQRFGSDAPDGTRVFDYPFSWEAPFVLIQGEKGGVIVRAEDPDYHFKTLVLEHADGRFRLRFETRNFAPFREKTKIESVPWRIEAYEGPWQVGAGIYRRWAEKAHDLTPLDRRQPSWAKDIRFVVIMGMDIPSLEALAKQIDPVQTLLYIPGWRKDGYDRNYPDYTPNPKFEPFVRAAHDLGFRVMPHVNYFGCDPKNPLYERFAKYQFRDPFSNGLQWWNWQRANPPIKFAYINPASREWRELFVSRMKELRDKYRVDALHLDQTLIMTNHADGLIDGMSSIEGNIALHRELREALPDVALSGEGLNEVTCGYEAFAQRHLVGIDFFTAAWDNRALGMAHPVSSAVLMPYTTIYGYLGMPNPESASGTHLAWLRGYDHYGVIPTLSRPTLDQLTDPPPIIDNIFREARFFQKNRPVADFGSSLGDDEFFLYSLPDGRKAFYGVDEGRILGVRDSDGKRTVITRRIEGLDEVTLPGSILGWPAYDAKRIFGLDPNGSYLWSPRARNLKALHIEVLPDGYTVARAGIHPEFARLALKSLQSTDVEPAASGEGIRHSITLVSDRPLDRIVTAEGDAEVEHLGGREYRVSLTLPNTLILPSEEPALVTPPLDLLKASHRDCMLPSNGLETSTAGSRVAVGKAACGGEARRSLHEHPPNQGRTVVDYWLKLPEDPVKLVTAIGLRDGSRSNGAGFAVEVNGRQVFEQSLKPDSGWVPVEVDLSPWVGKPVMLTLITDSLGDYGFDWAVWAEPRLVDASADGSVE